MKYCKNEAVVCTELDDGAILLNLDSKYYYNLNVTGLRIWQLLDSVKGAAEIARALTSEFKVDEVTALASTDRLIKELAGHGLILSKNEN